MSGFGKQIAARHAGGEYQARYFWIEALRLLSNTSVEAVSFEHPNSGKFDDVVTHYVAGHRRSEVDVSRDGAQLKYHVAGTDLVRWESFTDPAFLGEKSTSTLIEALAVAYQLHPCGFFTLVTTWPLDADSALCKAHRGDDSRLDLEKLFTAKIGEVAKVRKAMMSITGMGDAQLRAVLSRVVLQVGVRLDYVTRMLDAHLHPLGLEPIGDRLASHLDGLPYDLLRHAPIHWRRKHVLDVLKTHLRWTPLLPSASCRRVVGIRQFVKFAEHIEDGTDAFLDLVDRFAYRRPREAEDWNTTILPAIKKFVSDAVDSYHEVELRTSASLSIVYAVGASVHPKAPVRLYVQQSGVVGLQVWDTGIDTSSEDDRWDKREVSTGMGGCDVAVVVSITHDALEAVRRWVIANGIPVGRIMDFRVPKAGRDAIRGERHGMALVRSLVRQLPLLQTGVLHLFPAGPAAMILALGRLAQDIPCVHLYEFDFEKRATLSEYFPSIIIDRRKDL